MYRDRAVYRNMVDKVWVDGAALDVGGVVGIGGWDFGRALVWDWWVGEVRKDVL